MLNVDLQDFFPTINFGRVRGLFMAKPFGATPRVATILAQICCHDNSLPQGAPTSPVISNLICFRMDAQLLRLAAEHRCVYTRYADDMTFSKRKGEFPPELAHEDEDGRIVVSRRLLAIINDNGFNVHPTKVHLYHNTARQTVTGLTVNRRPNVHREFVRQIRAIIHDWKTRDLEQAEKRHHEDFYRYPNRNPKPPLKRIIEGKLNFLKMVRGAQDPVRKGLQIQLAGVWSDYKKVLYKENAEATTMRDFFISHASEDKDEIVRPLVDALILLGATVWYDEYLLKIGDRISYKINQGLRTSRFGVVVFSPSFFGPDKTWPGMEVGAMLAKEDSAYRSRILPIWHRVSKQDVNESFPLLADTFARNTADFTPQRIAQELVEVLQNDSMGRDL